MQNSVEAIVAEDRTLHSTGTIPADAFHADGFQGQRILVVPSHDLVVVHLGYMPTDELDKYSAPFFGNLTALFPEASPKAAVPGG